MEGFQKKSLKTTKGHTWTYYVSLKGNDKSLPAILMLHGWPDNALMYAGIAATLRKKGISLPMIIPDMLGYDGSSKPTDEALYAHDRIAAELVEIIDAEGFQQVISTGHDWGSSYAQRLYNFFPDRVAGLIMLNVPYFVPTKEKFDLDATNTSTEHLFGYPIFAYWYLFADPKEGPALMNANVERVYSAIHGAADDSMKNMFCVRDAFKNYLLSNGPEHEVRPYARDPKFKEAFISRLKRDGFDAPQCYYRAMRFGHHDEGNARIADVTAKVNVPTLYIGCSGDAVCRPEIMQPAIQAGLLPDLESDYMVEAGHWGPYEKPEEMGGIIADYLSRRFPTSAGKGML